MLRAHPIQLFCLLLLVVSCSRVQAQRNLKDIPSPDPEVERQTFQVAEGFEVNLYASDPMIAKPIHMNFDEQGRLWVASSEVYPQIKPGQAATDKIIVLEDKDRDGVADKRTVFVDQLLIPTGVLPGDGGVYVANSTDLVHFRDSNGDGQADQRRIVLSGFGTEDTHHLLHTLRWGPDGAMYMNQSIYIHSHLETPHGVRRLNGGGIWRFEPKTLRLDVFCRGFVNPWGHHFDTWGQSFATDGAYREGINYVFPGAVFVAAPNAQRMLTGLNPGSPKHCGLEIVSGRHMPTEWQGNMITNDFRANRVCRFVVKEDQSGYTSRQEVELIKSTHVAFRPVDVKMGPDGAIYIADWYNPIIQHGEVDFRDERRDHTHGRIWRITAKDRQPLAYHDLNQDRVRELLDALKLPEQWVRTHAKQILKNRDPDEVQSELNAWCAELPPSDDREHHLLEGLWLTQAMGRVDEQLARSLYASEDPRIRAAVLRVVAVEAGSPVTPAFADASAYLRQGVSDPHPRVRLEAIRGLAAMGDVDSFLIALEALNQPLDKNLDFALWQTVRDLQPQWAPRLARGQLDLGSDPDRWLFVAQASQSPEVVNPLMERLTTQANLTPDAAQELAKAIAVIGRPPQIQKLYSLLDLMPERESATRAVIVETLVNARKKPRTEGKELNAWMESPDLALARIATRAAGQWQVTQCLPTLQSLASQTTTRPAVRLEAIRALSSFGTEQAELLLRIFRESSDSAIRTTSLTSLATIQLPQAAQLSVQALTQPPSEETQALVEAVLARKGGAAALRQSLAKQSLHPESAKLAIRTVQGSTQQNPQLLEAIQRAGRLDEQKWKLSEQWVEHVVKRVQEVGDPQRGEQIYRRAELQCSKCHAIGGSGGAVGPDLISVGASAQVDYLIEALIDPKAKVKENYHTAVVVTDEGQIFSGIPVRENERELVLRDAEDREQSIPMDSIAQRREGRSIMPDGLVDPLTEDELVDLVTFLSRLGKVGEFSVGTRQLARTWQTLVWTQEGHRRLNRTSFDTAATADPALTWKPVYSKVSGLLPLEDLPRIKPHRETPETTFLRCWVEVTTPGQIALSFLDTTGLEVWLDGQPTPIEKVIQLQGDRGIHQITLAVDRETRSDPVQLEILSSGTGEARFRTGK